MKHLVRGALLLVVMTMLAGLAYPLALTGLAQFLFPARANGSLISRAQARSMSPGSRRTSLSTGMAGSASAP